MFKLTFSGNVIEFEKIGQVKSYLRHHRAVREGFYTLHHYIPDRDSWVRWDAYRNCAI